MVTPSQPLSEIDRIVGTQLQKLMGCASDRQLINDLLGMTDAELCNLTAGRQRMRARQILDLMQQLELPARFFYRPHSR